MYNLTVEEVQTFFVGEGQLLDHNLCPSAELAKNLLARIGPGAVQPAEAAAHHFVSHSRSNADAVASRTLLNRLGIGINEADNGVFLPRFLSSSNPAGAHGRVPSGCL